MILLLGGEKGGTGKSMIATALAPMRANEGRSVLFIDADPQGTSVNWNTKRYDNKFQPALKYAHVPKRKDLENVLNKYSQQFDDIIIDAGGQNSPVLRMAMLFAENLFTPLDTGQSDLWTIVTMSKLLEEVNKYNPSLTGTVFFNKVETSIFSTELAEAIEAFNQFQNQYTTNLLLSRYHICRRKQFKNAFNQGMSVIELDENGLNSKEIERQNKAKAEIINLYKEIYHV